MPYTAIVVDIENGIVHTDTFQELEVRLPQFHRGPGERTVFLVMHTDPEGNLVGTVIVEANSEAINRGWPNIEQYSWGRRR
jgi:hypothetical protein